MVSGFISRIVILVFGTLYPAYASYKAVRTKNVKEYVKWMMYWIVFALFTCAETFTDLFLGFWFPFYYEIKIITVVYLLSPATKGSSILYRKFVHPVLIKREQEIDEYIAKMKEQGYHTMLNLGSKGVNYATSFIMQTAIKGLPNLPVTPSSDFLFAKNSTPLENLTLEDDYSFLTEDPIKEEMEDPKKYDEEYVEKYVEKDKSKTNVIWFKPTTASLETNAFFGMQEITAKVAANEKDEASASAKGGGGLVNQLRKSYSLNDLSGQQDVRNVGGDSADSADYSEDPRLIRRNVGSTQSPALQTGLYFPEADISQRPDGNDYRHIPSYEKTGSGYPSGEPYYYGLQQPVGSHLTRTASLGPSSRIRTRASTKMGLPKRSTLSEEGPTRTSMELHESQNESENVYSFPLSHSASLPFVFHPYQHLVLPEYRHVFGSLTQNQMFTFINHTQSSQFLNNIGFDNFREAFEIAKVEDSVVISEEKSDDPECRTVVKNKLVQSDTPETNERIAGDKIVGIPADDKNLEGKDKRRLTPENAEKVAHLIEVAEVKDKPAQERSGKYYKKPAPIPPVEELSSKTTNLLVEEEDAGFFTPNASPKFTRKNSKEKSTEKNSAGGDENEGKPHSSNYLEVPKKSKTKAKKTDFIPKKLHMPKMTFSLFHSKGGKQASGSETSSVASVEISSANADGKNDLEYFIPLRDEESTSEGITETVQHKHDL